MDNPTRSRALPRAITLIELLAIVAAVVLLAVLIVPQFAADIDNATMMTRAMIEGSSTHLERFRMHCGRFPRQLDELIVRPTDVEGSNYWRGPYVKHLPNDAWGTPLGYACPGPHHPQAYDLWSFGPDRTSGTGDDITNWD